jgi:hypothetical protein
MLLVSFCGRLVEPSLMQCPQPPVFGAEILVFTLVRKRFKAIYEPRTYLTAEGYVVLH